MSLVPDMTDSTARSRCAVRRQTWHGTAHGGANNMVLVCRTCGTRRAPDWCLWHRNVAVGAFFGQVLHLTSGQHVRGRSCRCWCSTV